jgi:hypothetical protein
MRGRILIVALGLAGCAVEPAAAPAPAAVEDPRAAPTRLEQPCSIDFRAHFVLGIYDVMDLVGPDPAFPGCVFRVRSATPDPVEPYRWPLDGDALEELIRIATGPEAWEEPASYELHRAQLIVNQTNEAHAAIARALATIRVEIAGRGR